MPRLDADPDELRRLIVDEQWSFAAVARRFGVSDRTVGKHARKLGIEPTRTSIRRPELNEGTWLRDQFAAGRSIQEVADELGADYGTITQARRRQGISPKRAPRRTPDMAEVSRRLEAGESMAAIGRALGHHSSVISRAVRRATS